MDRIILKLLGLIIALSLLMNMTSLVYCAQSANINDEIGFLTETEVLSLQSEIEHIRTTYNHDVVIVITEKMNGQKSEVYADDYFDYNEYGLGENYNGILMLINMYDREVYFSTSGKSIDIFSDQRIDSMVLNAQSMLRNADYYGTCENYLSDVEHYLIEGVPAGAHRIEDTTYMGRVVRNFGNIFFYIGALVITIFAIVGITLSSKGKVTVNNRTYEDQNAFRMTNSIDQYLYQTTTRRKINTESSSGGGSSVHTGSSGRSHGGGGGSF